MLCIDILYYEPFFFTEVIDLYLIFVQIKSCNGTVRIKVKFLQQHSVHTIIPKR
jgi:hypothetical protein